MHSKTDLKRSPAITSQNELLLPDVRLSSIKDGFSGAYSRLQDFERETIDQIFEKLTDSNKNPDFESILKEFFEKSIIQLLKPDIDQIFGKTIARLIPILFDNYPVDFKNRTEIIIKDHLAAFFLRNTGYIKFHLFIQENIPFFNRYLKALHENPNNGTRESIMGGIRENIRNVFSNLNGLFIGINRFISEMIKELKLKDFDVELSIKKTKNFIKVKDKSKLLEIKLFLEKELQKDNELGKYYENQILKIEISDDNQLTILFGVVEHLKE
jgi:hypothetical protein